MLKKITEEVFEELVLHSTGPVLVDFGAEWCHPCKKLDPLVEELAEEWKHRVDVYKIDVDESASIAMAYAVMGVPTLMLFNQGEITARLTGFAHKNKLKKVFETNLPPQI
ncbi:MAG: thioredoxin [Anaerolineales bacterium]|nr:thioredoxin [Anaerolineales bacterium]